MRLKLIMLNCFQALLSSFAFKLCFQALLSSFAFNFNMRRYTMAAFLATEVCFLLLMAVAGPAGVLRTTSTRPTLNRIDQLSPRSSVWTSNLEGTLCL